jgi:hypothetical protein
MKKKITIDKVNLDYHINIMRGIEGKRKDTA